MPVTQAQVIDALRPVEDPELHRSIVDLGMVRNVGIDGTNISVQVALTVPGCPLRAEIDTIQFELHARHAEVVGRVGRECDRRSGDGRSIRRRSQGDRGRCGVTLRQRRSGTARKYSLAGVVIGAARGVLQFHRTHHIGIRARSRA